MCKLSEINGSIGTFRMARNYQKSILSPQVYLEGEFIGGCDIMLQMHQVGILKGEVWQFLFSPKFLSA